MFLKYLEPIFKPWRAVRNRIMKVRTVKGNIRSEARRVQRFGNVAKQQKNKVQGGVGKAQAEAQKMQGQAQNMQGQAQNMQGQAQNMQGQMPQARPGQMPGQMPRPMPQGAQMSGQAPGGFNPNPPIKVVGFFRRRKVCTQCNNELDKSWDSCPYCAQAAAAQQGPGPAPAAMKTQAFMLDPSGAGSVQLLGWLIPLKGPQRGELYTLAPRSVIGTEPTCQVVLIDHYMSSQHAEIKAEGGTWILRDLGSTNGTYVNDRRVDQHELVDNDFVKFGQSLVKFKSL
jgi:TolA-binding protein